VDASSRQEPPANADVANVGKAVHTRRIERWGAAPGGATLGERRAVMCEWPPRTLAAHAGHLIGTPAHARATLRPIRRYVCTDFLTAAERSGGRSAATPRGKHPQMVLVRLTDPMLNGDIYAFLAGTLPAKVTERRNVLAVQFTDSRDSLEELEAVRRITRAWQAAGHHHVGADVRSA
jgi:hypothetical protein